MTDKEKKNKIADILLDFYDEYWSNEINRPMIPSIYAGKIINSLQEELISKDLEKAAQKAYPEDIHKQSIFIHGATYAYTHSKNTQLLDEGLEEAATKYAQDKYMAVQTFQAFKAGANWQKKQDQETIELAEDHAMLAGMEKMKEQLMAKAIDARCFGFQDAALFSFRLPADKYLVGSEVKVIVIKED